MARQVQVLLVLQAHQDRLGQLEWELQVRLVQVARLDLMVQVDHLAQQGQRQLQDHPVRQALVVHLE